MLRFRKSGFGLVVGAILLCAGHARAQSYPDKPVHIIVGVSPGGATDFTARALAQQLTALWHQPVIVENRPGAAGAIANEYVAKAAPDGYTLLVSSNDITALSAYRADLPYNLSRDFTPVSLLSAAPMVLVVKKSLAVNNMKQLIALAQSEPGWLTYGTPGVGSMTHLQTARFAPLANIKITHVPYKGGSAAVVGVADGEVDMTFAGYPPVRAMVAAGKVKILGVAALQRSALFPQLPTISDAGGPPFAYTGWYALFAPGGMPKDVLAALNAAVVKVDGSPAMVGALAKQGLQAQAESPAQFAAFVRGDLGEAQKMVAIAGLKPK